MKKNDRQALAELYVNSNIKKEIKKLIKEGKSKAQIHKILQEAGFFDKISKGVGNMVQGAKNLKQNYWDDPRAISAGQKAGYGMKGQAARSKGQTAYNRQTTIKFQNEITSTLKSLDKSVDKSVYAINKTIFKSVNDLFAKIKEDGPNLDPNFLAQQFEAVYNSLNAAKARSTGALSQNYDNIINQLTAMGKSLQGGMQQAQQPAQQQPAAPQQQQPAAPQAPPPAAGTPRNNLTSTYQNQNVAGNFAQPNAQINASTNVRIHKRDHVLMESAYDQVLSKNK